MFFRYLLITTILAPAAGFGLLTLGDGQSVFQKLIDRFYAIPKLLLGNIAFQPETLMNVTQIIRLNGFPAEEHSVVTEDGYILGVQRISPKNVQPDDQMKLHPIMFVHGYFGYAGNFVSNSPANAPAFIFANAGFDVWLVNQRGTEYSRAHKTLNPNKAEFWKYSWDEVAAYDLPACIDHILNVTGHKQILFLGHSLGAALPFALLATRPEYMAKIKEIYALAPTVDLANISETIKISAPAAPLYKIAADRLGIYEFKKYPPQLTGYLGKYFDSLVREILFLSYGKDYEQWNSSRTEVNLAHLISSSSLYIYYHESQLVVKPGFRKFDWGERINRQKYGQPHPPDYNISGISVPTHIYYGDNDRLAPINNAQFLAQRLKNATMHPAGEHWNYLDFLWAKDAAKFYNDIIASIKSRS